jgi:site-specific recombinase XerD
MLKSLSGLLDRKAAAPNPKRRRLAGVDDSIDRRGYQRSPVTKAGYRLGQPPGNKGRKFPPEPLTSREVIALLSAIPRGNVGSRNRALVTLLWRAGLRITEALELYPKDVDLARGQVSVLEGKGRKRRVVGVDDPTCEALHRWFRVRTELGLNGSHPVFCVVSKPTTGMPMHSAYARNMVKDAAARAGIEKRAHPHGLRHTNASDLADEGVDLRLISRHLGHSTVGVTAPYIDHLNPRQVVEAIRARQWPTDAAMPGPGAPGGSAPEP